MDFDTDLARITGFLSHTTRTLGPLDQLKLDEKYDVVLTVLDLLKSCISTLSESELRRCHLFLLLNTDLAISHCDQLENADWGHFIGIAPTLSTDLFLALSIELTPLEEFIYEVIALMPLSIALDVAQTFVSSVYFRNEFSKVIEGMYILCNALGHNILMRKHHSNCRSFSDILAMVLSKIAEEANDSDFCTYLTLLKAPLSVLKLLLKQESPFINSRWRDLYEGYVNVDKKLTDAEHDDILASAKLLSSKCFIDMCSKMPEKSKAEECDAQVSLLQQSTGELAYECLSDLKSMPYTSIPLDESLLDALDQVAQKPWSIVNEIEEADLSSLCRNACVEGENQHLWVKALLSYKDVLEKEEAINVLSTVVHLIFPEDVFMIFHAFVLSNEGSCDSLKTLALNSLSGLDLEDKLELLMLRISWCGIRDICDEEGCEFQTLEVLNRLVAQQDANCQDQLVELAIKCPQLMVKHILQKGVQNELFSTSVIAEILVQLKCVFTCPAETSTSTCGVINITELLLSDIMSDSKNFDKECGGIQNLVKQLIQKHIIDVKYFLHSCIFPALEICTKQFKESTIILLLHMLLDVQTGFKGWEKWVNLPSLLVFLGQLLEFFVRNANSGDSEATLVREAGVRNIEQIFRLRSCADFNEDAEKDWLLKELSLLSPVNRHYYSALWPEWMLLHGEDRTGIITVFATHIKRTNIFSSPLRVIVIILSILRGLHLNPSSLSCAQKVLPLLHVTEWHLLIDHLPRLHGDDEANNFEAALIFCSAVNLIVSGFYHRKHGKLNMNLRGCFRSLASVVKSCVARGVASHHAPQILGELLQILGSFPKSEQFELAMFTLPLMLELVDYGCGNGQVLTTFGQLVLSTSVCCVRRDLGRQLKKLAVNFVNGNAE